MTSIIRFWFFVGFVSLSVFWKMISKRCRLCRHSHYCLFLSLLVYLTFARGSTVNSLDPIIQRDASSVAHDRFFQLRRRRGKLSIELDEPKVKTIAAPLPSMNSTGSVREVVSQTVKDLSRRIQQQQNAEQSLTSKTQKKEQPVEISLSVDAISLFRLSKIIGMASMGFFGAFGATLRLLAPIIVARRCLAFVAYAWLDHYNGRFLRTTYNDRLQDFQKYEIPSVLRSCGRSTTQLVAMGIVGRVVREILKRMPCWMPSRICQQFYGVIWACLVLLARRGADLWVSGHIAASIRFFFVHFINL